MSTKDDIRAKSLKRVPHLTNWVLPPWMVKAMAELGETEVAGKGSNPRILDYRKIAALPFEGEDGVVPWCAIFINAMLAGAGITGSQSAMARSFAISGAFERLDAPMVGCITVISSSRGPASGHVFFYAGENGIMFAGLGGNQSDAVSVDFFQKSRLVGHFWPRGVAKLPPPFDKPVRLARPLLPHEKRALAGGNEVRDA